jgi:hypothetical protein
VKFNVILVDGATEAYDGTFKGERNGGLEIVRDDKNEPIVRREAGEWLRMTLSHGKCSVVGSS